MTTPAEDQEMAAFVAWAVNMYGQHAYRHTSATSGEWAAWKAARCLTARQATERVLATVIVDGETPEKLLDAIAQRVADVGKRTGA